MRQVFILSLLRTSVPMSPADWREHFHPFWERFEHAKRRFDPDHVLTPGQRIF